MIWALKSMVFNLNGVYAGHFLAYRRDTVNHHHVCLCKDFIPVCQLWALKNKRPLDLQVSVHHHLWPLRQPSEASFLCQTQTGRVKLSSGCWQTPLMLSSSIIIHVAAVNVPVNTCRHDNHHSELMGLFPKISSYFFY